jgi:hypothetical protein
VHGLAHRVVERATSMTDRPCVWCGRFPALPNDILCVSCWGAKTAGLSREEAIAMANDPEDDD